MNKTTNTSRAAHPLRAGLPLLLPAAWMLALLVLLLALLAAGALWLLRSDEGTRWLLPRLPGVQASGVRGALLSPHFEADRLRLQWAGGQASLTLQGLQADGLEWRWRPQPGAWVGLDARTLAATRVAFDPGPPAAAKVAPALAPPATLALPLRLQVQSLRIGELQIAQGAPLRRLQASLQLGIDGQHSLHVQQLEWDRLRLQGQARIATTPPFALQAQLQATPLAPGDVFNATLQASGPLARLNLQATLRGAARGRHAAPKADLHAVVMPFAAWPLGALSADTEALDLATLLSAAPETRLSGRVQVRSESLQAPISASVRLDNTIAGRWDEGRLPLRRLQLDIQAVNSARNHIQLKQLDAMLGSAAQGGGRISAHGEWAGHTLQLQTQLQQVLPQALDGRASAMTLSGPLALTLQGLPSPDPAAQDAPPPWALALKGVLDGRLAAVPQAVQLKIDARADAGHVELLQLRAQAGAALAQLTARAERDARGRWQLSTSGSLDNFDPQPWWPGDARVAWNTGSNRLSADWQLKLAVPAAARRLAPLALLQSLAGSGRLQVHDSVLAGVPLALDVTLGQTPASPATPSELTAALHLAGNVLRVSAHGNPGGPGEADALEFDLDAPSLGALGPVFKLAPGLAVWAPRAGSAHASVSARGRWPLLRTQGRAELKGLQAGALALTSGRLNWQLDTREGDSQPLTLVAELNELQLGKQRAHELRAELSGSLRQHRLLVTGALPLAPPPLAEQLLGLRATAGTRALLQAQGQWRADSAGGGRWQGHVSRFVVGNWDGKALPEPGQALPAQWLDARDLDAQALFGADGSLRQIQAAAGKLQLASGATLRWDEVNVEWPPDGADGAGGPANFHLKAQVEPFSVAPLLARLQPDMGWSGDLRLKARLELRAAQRFDADLMIEREDGDLYLSDEQGSQLMGLTELRVKLAAHDGQWTLDTRLAGRALGELDGSVSLQTDPALRWPAADAPLHGTLQAQVANLGVWGSWVPAGWRLGGTLRTELRIGGRFGAPEYTGSLRASQLAVRNLLQGVNVSDGELALTLKGETAEIERFTLKGGDGTLTLTGGASFGDTPQARLHLQAEHFRLLGRIDRQLVASGSAEMQLSAERIKLDGRFSVDEGLFDTTRGDAPSLDDDVTVRRAGDAAPSAEAPVAPKPRRDMQVAIEVDLGQNLRVRGHGLDTALRGKLRISTPGGRLSVQGVVNTEGGTYKAYGQKLEIERGIVAFSGEPGNPRLDILALRPNIDNRVGVAITGNVLTPHVQLYADTEMSDTDKLSWLVLGRASDGLGRTDTALLQRAAVALFAGEGEAPTDALMRSLGIDELSLRQSDSDVHETVISLGKQLSQRWYVGYERGVNATSGTFQLVYRIAQRFTLRAQSGLENAIDIIWVWRFNQLPQLPRPKAQGQNAGAGTGTGTGPRP